MSTSSRFKRLVWSLAICGFMAAAGAAHGDTTAPDGAVGTNIQWEQHTQKCWYIEIQREGAQNIEDGIAAKSAKKIQQGISALDWGFAKQAGDGSFPGTGNGTSGEPFHSASLFIEAAARSVLDLKAYDPKTYGTWIQSAIPHIQVGALWLMSPTAYVAGQKYNAPYTHRRYILASALLEAGVATGNTAIANASLPYLTDGLSRQTPTGWAAAIQPASNGKYPPAVLVAPGKAVPTGTVSTLSAAGVNVEDNGYDVNYQCVGLVFAAYYAKNCPDANVRQSVLSMIARGLAFETQLIDKSGNVTAIGSTRIDQEVDLTGSLKVLSTGQITKAFQLAYGLTGNASYQGYATLIK
jgi:hypothetical protein